MTLLEMTPIKKLRLEELDRPSIEQYRARKKTPIRLILDNVRSALNVGSCFRTADGCAISGIDLCGITAYPPHKEIKKTAIGADLSVDWKFFDDVLTCIKQRKNENYQMIVLEQTNHSIYLNHWIPFESSHQPLAIVVGNEVDGVQQRVLEQADRIVEIPQYGTKHSFNVAVSVGMVLWHCHIASHQKKS